MTDEWLENIDNGFPEHLDRSVELYTDDSKVQAVYSDTLRLLKKYSHIILLKLLTGRKRTK